MMLLAALAGSVAVGPALRIGPPNPDNTPVILVLDGNGRVATRITCLRNEWVNPEDSATKLISSTKVAATVVAKNGYLTDLDDLGPAKFDCVIMPANSRDGRPVAR